MKITKLEVFPVSIPYENPYQISLGITKYGNHVVVKLMTDEGVTGIGETSLILPDITGETQENIVNILKRNFEPLIIGEDPFNIERIMDKLDHITLGRYAFPYSKTAIDHALWDLMGKKLGVPVYKLIGGSYRSKVGVSRSLPITTLEKMTERAIKLKKMGYKMLTIKIGFDPIEDIKRVEAVRNAIGDNFPIEVDVNQGYTPDIAIRTLKIMEEYGIENVEQPVAWWDIDGMAKVTHAIETPVIADESATRIFDIIRIAKLNAADIICLKLVKSGGIYHCKKMAAVAESVNLPCSMGSRHTFGIGTAAIHHFACSTWNVSDVIGYGTPTERFVDDIIKEPIPISNGEVFLSSFAKPGLGVELDEKKLNKYISK